MKFEEGLAELEQLAQALERGTMPLDESFRAYSRACELKKALEEILRQGDEKIRILTEEGENSKDASEIV